MYIFMFQAIKRTTMKVNMFNSSFTDIGRPFASVIPQTS